MTDRRTTRKVTIEGLMEYLPGLTKNAAYGLVRRGLIPYERLGGKRGKLYFDLDRVDAKMREQGNGDVAFQQPAPTARERAAGIADRISASV